MKTFAIHIETAEAILDTLHGTATLNPRNHDMLIAEAKMHVDIANAITARETAETEAEIRSAMDNINRLVDALGEEE